MKICVKLFAIQAQRAGQSQMMLDLTEGATVAEAMDVLRKTVTEMPWPTGTLVAVNQEYAGMTTPLHANDEVAVIPPVSGG
jgi:molybdopterin converting factor small subunit